MFNPDQLLVHFKDDDLKTSVYVMFAGKKIRPDDVKHLDVPFELRNFHPVWYNYPGFSRCFDIPSAHTNYFQWTVEESGAANADIRQRLRLIGVPESTDIENFIQGEYESFALFVNTAEDRFRKGTFYITVARNAPGNTFEVLRVEIEVPKATEHPQYMNGNAAKAS
ncbi:MAG: hypothetical protein V4616_05625 [Bacteroidota bacterium]